MLFYNQIKREFSPTTWRSAQNLFRENRVREVRLNGDQVTGKVRMAGEQLFEVSLTAQRGTIGKSSCSCKLSRIDRKACEHIGALAIYVVERGSLLRLGISDDEEEEIPEITEIPADPVAYIRGIFEGKAFKALSVEPALRYTDPESGQKEIRTMHRLTPQVDPQAQGAEEQQAVPEATLSARGVTRGEGQAKNSLWKTGQGLYLRTTREEVPYLFTLNTAQMLHQGPDALAQLAKFLGSKARDRIEFHEGLDVELDPAPLKLVSMNVGRRSDRSRVLSYEFKNPRVTFSSEDLAELSAVGRLSNDYVWKGNRLYRFETSLATLAQYANRSGIAAPDAPKGVEKSDGFSYLHDDNEHPLHPLAAFRLSLELGVENFIVDPEWKEFHEWLEVFNRKKTPSLPRVDYGFSLRDYQKNGLSWMWSLYHRGLSALLADDMGLGKTHQVLAFLTTLYRSRTYKPKQPSLVIAPTSVVAAWSQKLAKYDTGLKWHVFHGKGRKLPDKDVQLVLTTYGILQREAILREREWHVVALDEAQAVKNASTISSRASRVLRSKFKIAMTGTPVENQSTDLWSIMEFLLPGYLGSLARFKRLYGSGREAPSQEQADALKRLISPFLLRRTKTQVLKELPEKTEEVIPCQMTSAQKKAYRAYLNSAEASRVRENLEGSGKVDYASVLTLLTRLKQVCAHPKLVDLTSGKIKSVKTLDPSESGKWEAFEELLHEALGSNLKIVVFTQYLGMMDLIGHSLKTKNVGYVDLRGDTQDRQKRLERFATDPDCRVFVCSLLAGGLGIDLTAGSVCIHLDRWWNPAKENQATDRLHRIGQTRGVQVFKLQIAGTIEDRIADIIQSKSELSGTLIEESSLGLKAFSRKELLELLTPTSEDSDEPEEDEEDALEDLDLQEDSDAEPDFAQ